MTTATENHQSTFSLLLKVFFHLSIRRRIQFGLILTVMLTSGIAELVSLGAVLPFLTAISNPDKLSELKILQYLSEWNITIQSNDLVLLLTLAFGLSVLLAMVIRVTNLWVNNQLVAAIGSDLSIKAFHHTLYQPYESYLQWNSATLITSMTAHISRSVSAFANVMQIITSSVVAVFIIGGLLFINWSITCFSAVTIAVVYTTLAFTARKQLQRNSKVIASLTKKQVQSIQESLGAFRDVILDSSQDVFLKPYSACDRAKRKKQATNLCLAGFPKYIIESIGILIIISISAYLSHQNTNNEMILPLLGVIALGSQRLLPAFQQIYSGWCSLKNFGADLNGLCTLLDQELPYNLGQFEPLILEKSIDLSNISYKYSEDSHIVIDKINVKFSKGQRIGIIGTTGSGKSTLIDILMGLLKPTRGQLIVDGNNLHEMSQSISLLKWRSSIAHVPQSIYLSDASIAENIAFGEAKERIDMSRVISSAKKAQIHAYIESISQGYDSYVGERGIRLSGGQRQRIGIARALYKNAKVLVLDEATSALDDATEKLIMEFINKLGDDLTIFMIAHRQSTLKDCDRIFKLESANLIEVNPESIL